MRSRRSDCRRRRNLDLDTPEMTLQERILEALGEHALKPRALYDHFLNDLPASLDFALRGLMKSGQVTFELGHYQRSTSAKPSQPKKEVGYASAALNRGTEAPAGAAARPPSASPPPQSFDPRELTKREREVYDLAEQGLTRRQIMERLGVSANVVSTRLSNARNKLGVKAKLGAPSRQNRPSDPAPSAAGRLTAAPSREGAETATVGADPPPSNEAEKREVKTAPRLHRTFSRDLIERLIATQTAKAQKVQDLCNQLSVARQELADAEELVRIATEERTAAT